jgi:SNF2 family DNA or RNA helicase
VQVHKRISIGTLEERIDELIECKKAIADRVVGSGEAWVSELSEGALCANALGG